MDAWWDTTCATSKKVVIQPTSRVAKNERTGTDLDSRQQLEEKDGKPIDVRQTDMGISSDDCKVDLSAGIVDMKQLRALIEKEVNKATLSLQAEVRELSLINKELQQAKGSSSKSTSSTMASVVPLSSSIQLKGSTTDACSGKESSSRKGGKSFACFSKATSRVRKDDNSVASSTATSTLRSKKEFSRSVEKEDDDKSQEMSFDLTDGSYWNETDDEFTSTSGSYFEFAGNPRAKLSYKLGYMVAAIAFQSTSQYNKQELTVRPKASLDASAASVGGRSAASTLQESTTTEQTMLQMKTVIEKIKETACVGQDLNAAVHRQAFIRGYCRLLNEEREKNENEKGMVDLDFDLEDVTFKLTDDVIWYLRSNLLSSDARYLISWITDWKQKYSDTEKCIEIVEADGSKKSKMESNWRHHLRRSSVDGERPVPRFIWPWNLRFWSDDKKSAENRNEGSDDSDEESLSSDEADMADAEGKEDLARKRAMVTSL